MKVKRTIKNKVLARQIEKSKMIAPAGSTGKPTAKVDSKIEKTVKKDLKAAGKELKKLKKQIKADIRARKKEKARIAKEARAAERKAKYDAMSDMDKLKHDISIVNSRARATFRKIEKNAKYLGIEIKGEVLKSTPAPLQAMEHWAQNLKTNKFMKGTVAEGEVPQFISGKKIDELSPQDLKRLREMIYGNDRAESDPRHRVGMLNSKTFTKAGREQALRNSYEGYVNKFLTKETKDAEGNIIKTKTSDMSFSQYKEWWEKYDEARSKLEAAGVYAEFYEEFKDAVSKGIFQESDLEWYKWLNDRLEENGCEPLDAMISTPAEKTRKPDEV